MFRYHAVSTDGKWLVGRTSSGFTRVNLETRQILTFSKYNKDYGYGIDPSYLMAISNDGRHVVVRESDVSSFTIKMYDLSTCESEASIGREVVKGCRSRDVKDIMAPGGTQSRPGSFYFSDDGNVLMYLFYEENGQLNRRALMNSSQGRYDYIALGDSYSSGEGVLNGAANYRKGTDRDGEKYPESNTGIAGYPYEKEVCHQSDTSYPFLLMRRTGGSSNSVACSGAKMSDILSSYDYSGHFSQFKLLDEATQFLWPYVKSVATDNLFPGRAPQIEMLKKYKPRIATIGVGGNDIDFAGKLTNCIYPTSTCSFANDLRYYSGIEIQNMHKRYLSLFRALKAASPATRLYAVGYPQFLARKSASASEGCSVNVGLDHYEREFIIQSVDYLNLIIKSAANSSGVSYLDIGDSLQGKALCDDDWVAGMAVNGVDNGNDQHAIIGNESFHPTDIGHQMIYDTIDRLIGHESIATFQPCGVDRTSGLCPQTTNSVTPHMPAYFTSDAAADAKSVDAQALGLVVDTIGGVVDGGVNTAKGAVAFVKKGAEVSIRAVKKLAEQPTDIYPSYLFLPGSSVRARIFSVPADLGELTAGADGNLVSQVALPADLPYGAHTIVLTGKNSLQEEVMYYQNIYLYATNDDLNGDGTPDKAALCGVLPSSGIDVDHDRVDDACDKIIYEPPDTTPPVVTTEITEEANSGGWYNHDVIVKWLVSDDRDTLEKPAEVIASREGEYTYESQEVCDRANNCATGRVTIKIDKTPPSLGEITWTANPKLTSSSTTMSVDIEETGADIDRVEYFIGDNDPGQGNGGALSVNDKNASADFLTDLQTGIHKVSVRVKDNAGNWSELQVSYLTVYDESKNISVHGHHTLLIDKATTAQLPSMPSDKALKAYFGLMLRRDNKGRVSNASDFHFAYSAGECKRLGQYSCKTFYVNARTIDSVVLGGLNKSMATIKASVFVVKDWRLSRGKALIRVVDGERHGGATQDSLSFEIYPENDLPFMPSLYSLPVTIVHRGEIKVR